MNWRLRSAAFGVSDARDTDWVKRRLTPHPLGTYTSMLNIKGPVGNNLPRTYIHCTNPSYVALQGSRDWIKAQAGQYPEWLHPAWEKTTSFMHFTSTARSKMNAMQRERVALLEGFDESRNGLAGVWLSSTAILNVTPRDDGGVNPHRRAGHRGRHPHSGGSRGDRSDRGPHERAVALSIVPRVVMVRYPQILKARLLRHDRLRHKLLGPPLLAG